MKGPILLIVLLLMAAGSIAQTTDRIRFARGAHGANVTGRLNGYNDERDFLIRVRACQTLRTEQIGGTRPITIYIVDPNGESVGDSDASCNNRREIAPTVAGDYRIQVVECQKANTWRGTFRFRVTVR